MPYLPWQLFLGTASKPRRGGRAGSRAAAAAGAPVASRRRYASLFGRILRSALFIMVSIPGGSECAIASPAPARPSRLAPRSLRGIVYSAQDYPEHLNPFWEGDVPSPADRDIPSTGTMRRRRPHLNFDWPSPVASAPTTPRPAPRAPPRTPSSAGTPGSAPQIRPRKKRRAPPPPPVAPRVATSTTTASSSTDSVPSAGAGTLSSAVSLPQLSALPASYESPGKQDKPDQVRDGSPDRVRNQADDNESTGSRRSSVSIDDPMRRSVSEGCFVVKAGSIIEQNRQSHPVPQTECGDPTQHREREGSPGVGSVSGKNANDFRDSSPSDRLGPDRPETESDADPQDDVGTTSARPVSQLSDETGHEDEIAQQDRNSGSSVHLHHFEDILSNSADKSVNQQEDGNNVRAGQISLLTPVHQDHQRDDQEEVESTEHDHSEGDQARSAEITLGIELRHVENDKQGCISTEFLIINKNEDKSINLNRDLNPNEEDSEDDVCQDVVDDISCKITNRDQDLSNFNNNCDHKKISSTKNGEMIGSTIQAFSVPNTT